MTNKQMLKRWFPYCSVRKLKQGEIRAQKMAGSTTGYRLFFPVALREAIEVADIFFTEDQRLILKVPIYGFAPKPYPLTGTNGEDLIGEISDLIDHYIRERDPRETRSLLKEGKAHGPD